MDLAVNRIRAKIAKVQHLAFWGGIRDKRGHRAWLSHHIFGGSRHRWRLSPPLPESAIASWESERAVTLPPEYRLFLKEIGHAGMGPYYGLRPLSAAKRYTPDQKKLFCCQYRGPCIYTEIAPGPDEDWIIAVAGNDWEKQYAEGTFSPHQGTLCLCHQGCGYETVLVLNGPHRGRVVNTFFEDPPVFSPYLGTLSWYEGWLDQMLTGNTPAWHGYPLRSQ